MEKMNGDWERWLAMPRKYQSRSIAEVRVNRMLAVARDHDEAVRHEMRRRDGGR